MFILEFIIILYFGIGVNTIDITTKVFGSNTHYLPAAFGDFNADKLTDIFVIEKASNGSDIVRILLSDSLPPLMKPTGPSCTFNKIKIKSIIPSDFDGDGAMDIVVITFEENIYNAHVLWGNLKTLECLDEPIKIAQFKSQPVLMDYNGDMISDLFGEGVDGKRYFWVFGHTRRKPTKVLMKYSDDSSPISLSGGHAFVDIDEDFSADLWLSVKDHFEVWFSLEKYTTFDIINYPLAEEDKHFPVIGQTTFFDIDLDGKIEVLLPLCTDSACKESLFYICEFENSIYKWYPLKVNLKDADEITWSFPSERASYRYTNTITPRVGDANMDGYPDILMTVFNGNTPKVILLINSECKDDCKYPRTFVPNWNILNPWSNSVMGTFFDFEEDGTLEIILVNSSSDGQTYSVAAYKDSVEYDAMFLKVLVMTGQCYENCPNHKIPYGTNQPGPSVAYSMLSGDGKEQSSYATQLTQSSHFALQLPFTLFGLGRNWNFVDKLKIGIPLNHEMIKNKSDSSYSKSGDNGNGIQKAEFTQIIPNSQLKVIPFPMDDSSQWTTELFITPSKAMLMTAGALIATCLFVAAIILILHYKEKVEDKKERRQQAQRFHFDAM